MKLLLIEDDVAIARELSFRWRSRSWHVVTCGTLAEARPHFNAPDVDLVVLDLQLPDGDGMEWLRSLRQNDHPIPVLVLTARDRVADRVAGLRGGADDYLVKPFSADELDARIDVLRRRIDRQIGSQLRCGPLVWLKDEGRAELAGAPLELSPRELQVLGLLIRKAPQLVPKRVLADALAERNLDLTDGAVEVYVSRLRRKLQGSSVSIHTVRGFGYRMATAGANDEG